MQAYQTKFVSAGVNGLDAWQFEVPLEACFGVGEWCDESSRRTVDVDRDIMARLGFKIVKNLRDFFDWLVMTGVCGL